MPMQIVPYQPGFREAIVRLSLRAWAPVFESIEQAMDGVVFREFYPDWREQQREAVETVCADPAIEVFVALAEGEPAGFVAAKLQADAGLGEIYMVAVDPDHQGSGIGSALTAHALRRMKEVGISVAMVETGEDPGHGGARRTYERAGFRKLPIARYFKKL